MDLEADYTELLETLDSLVALLRQHREDHWADWLARNRRLIANGDAHGITHFLSAFGGMGSLNDLVIHPSNGHDVAPDDIAAVNQQFMNLASHAHASATRLRHNLRGTIPGW
jgi:hypothetical protein